MILLRNDDDCTAVFAYAPDGPYDCPDEVASTWNTEEDDGNALGNITVECSGKESFIVRFLGYRLPIC